MKKYFLYYAGFNKKTQEEQVGVATSVDLSTWHYVGDVPQIPLKTQGRHDALQTSNPCVLRHGGIYKMWYQGKSESGFLSVCYAESKDGISWSPYTHAVLSEDLSRNAGFREGFQHPHVLFNEEKKIFQMWCVLYKNNMTSIGFSESSDGISWSSLAVTSIVSNDSAVKYFYPCVLREGVVYRMWFTKRVRGEWSICTATSLNGIEWIFDIHNPLIAPSFNKLAVLFFEGIAKYTGVSIELPLYGIGSPFVWRDGGLYKLVAHAVGPRGKLYIPLYESTDGLSWKKIKNNILPKPHSDWNSFFQADPYLYVE